MTKQQIRWAADHDWFIRGRDNWVEVRDFEWDDNIQEYDEVYLKFDDIYELRAWAGY